MVLRQSPEMYFTQPQTEHSQPMQIQPMYTETVQIPEWVPILLGIALVGAFAIALYALKKR